MFICALRPRGEPLSRRDIFGYMARLKRPADTSLQSMAEGPFAAVAVSSPAQMRPHLARWRQLVGAGDVRLDNRAEVASHAGVRSDDVASDLELVLAALDRLGERCIPRILGDFAFVVWDARAHKLLAVRDAFGVKSLFHREAAGLVLFSSEIAPLQLDESYDTDYVAGYLCGQARATTRTIWNGISAVAAGAVMRQRGTVLTSERYWRSDEYAPAEHGDEEANCRRFRELLEEGVRTRLDGAGETWAQLSGGLDSSAVVAVAQLMRRSGAPIAGTVTVVDTLGAGDERAYSDAVVERYQLRNEQVRDYWAWQDDGEEPPRADQPTNLFPFYARDRRLYQIVRNAGGRVLLSGLGADHYLTGNLNYITDLASSGQVGTALRELTTWSVATRQSFWRLGRRYLLEPFLPRTLLSGASPPPTWLAPGLTPAAAAPAARPPWGHRFAHQVAQGLDALPAWIERFPFGQDIEMRYPFLYRPLVEWSLRLPAQQRVRPHERKWILRQATRDVLPEAVRTRSSKGGIDARLLWSLHRERVRVDAMLRDPILAQLGCVDADRLRADVDAARRGVPLNNVHLFSALSLETWLAVRTGTWSVLPRAAAVAA